MCKNISIDHLFEMIDLSKIKIELYYLIKENVVCEHLDVKPEMRGERSWSRSSVIPPFPLVASRSEEQTMRLFSEL
jgi:hypothetical protein